MNIALVVNKVSESKESNFKEILKYIEISANNGAKIVVFAEAALTGLLNKNNPKYDFSLCVKIPGKETNILANYAKKYGIYLSIGLLEKSHGKIYDTAILINDEGKIVLKYRRVSRGWLDWKANRDIYSCGKDLVFADTKIGKVTFLICGDLFDDTLVGKVIENNADFVIVPMARSFEDCSYSQIRWDREKRAYLERISILPGTVCLVNYLSNIDCSFGGAMIVRNGRIIAEKKIGKDGILFAEV